METPRHRFALAVAVALLLALTTSLTGASAGAAPGDTHVSLVRDVYPGDLGSGPADLEVAGGNLFYAATHPTYGRELWMTNAAGTTKMVRNLQPDPDGFAVGSHPRHLTAVGSRVFFLASDAAQDEELYVSDGTAAGTKLVEELNPFDDAEILEMTAVGNTLFFVLTDTFGDHELWKSDGTPLGTRIVRKFNQVQDPNPHDLEEMGGLLYFSAFLDTQLGSAGVYLWKSDGTPAGTVPVKRLNLVAHDLTAVGDQLFFNALVAGNHLDSELWVSDGTSAGTKVVRNIKTNAGQGSDPDELTAVGDLLYFSAEDNAGDRELYRSDGTAAGTRRVRNLRTGGDSNPKNLTDVNGTAFFSALTDDNRIELFVSSDALGTRRLPSTNPLGVTDPQELTAVGDLLFYRARTALSKDQLWVTDGTAAGTRAVGQESPANDGSPGDLAERNGELYLRDGVEGPADPFGHELYRVTVAP